MKFSKREIMSGEGNILFLKFKDGESHIGVPRGEVYEFYQKWENNRSKVVDANDPDGKSRFRINFVVQEDGKFVPRILEFGLTVYNQLADIAEEYDITQTKLKITRRGTGTDTVYMVLPLLKEPIPAKVMKQIEAVPLNILEHKDKPAAAEVNGSGLSDHEEIPF